MQKQNMNKKKLHTGSLNTELHYFLFKIEFYASKTFLDLEPIPLKEVVSYFTDLVSMDMAEILLHFTTKTQW